MWPESTAGCGSNEDVSCLHHYLQTLVGVDTLIIIVFRLNLI